MSFHDRCCLCEVLLKNKLTYSLIDSQTVYDRINSLYELLHSRSLKNDCKICNVCYQKHLKLLKLPNRLFASWERLSSIESMDVDFKFDKATQTDGKVLCSKGITCSLLISDSILLPVYVPQTPHKYCAICKKKFSAVPFTEITDDIRFHACSIIWFTSNQVVVV